MAILRALLRDGDSITIPYNFDIKSMQTGVQLMKLFEPEIIFIGIAPGSCQVGGIYRSNAQDDIDPGNGRTIPLGYVAIDRDREK